MARHYDPISGTVRDFGRDGFTIDDGPKVYNPDADEDRKEREARERAAQAQRLEEALRPPVASDSLPSHGNRRSSDDSLLGWILICFAVAVVMICCAISHVLKTWVRFHWIETATLAGVTLTLVYWQKQLGQRGSPSDSVAKKIKRVRTWAIRFGVATIGIPLLLSIRTYFFAPPLPLAIEKLDTWFFARPADFRGSGEEGLRALTTRMSQPNPPVGEILLAVAAIGRPGFELLNEQALVGAHRAAALQAIASLKEGGEEFPRALSWGVVDRDPAVNYWAGEAIKQNYKTLEPVLRRLLEYQSVDSGAFKAALEVIELHKKRQSKRG